MRGNWSELTPAQRSPQYHVNTPLEHNIGVKVLSDNLNTETANHDKAHLSLSVIYATKIAVGAFKFLFFFSNEK